MSFLMVLQWEHREHKEQGWFLRGSPGPACDRCLRGMSRRSLVSALFCSMCVPQEEDRLSRGGRERVRDRRVLGYACDSKPRRARWPGPLHKRQRSPGVGGTKAPPE